MPQEKYRMPKIIPIRDLKNTTEVLKLCEEVHEPVFVTKNGYGTMVIMSMDTFETKLINYADEHTLADIDYQIEDLKECRKNNPKHVELYRKLEEGFKDIADGCVVDAFTAMKERRAKYGL